MSLVAVFFYQYDDTEPADACWFDFLKRDEYKAMLVSLFGVVKNYQSKLSELTNNYLLQNELQLIKNNQHPQDFSINIDRLQINVSNFADKKHSPDPLFYTFISDLIKREDIKSISFPYGGFIWRIFLEEQVRRAKKLGINPQEAFALYGSDEGLGDLVRPENWGGYVHIPYEGMCSADLVFLPTWRVFHKEDAGSEGSLAKASRLDCRYMIVFKENDLGELGCATRQAIGEWIFYQAN